MRLSILCPHAEPVSTFPDYLTHHLIRQAISTATITFMLDTLMVLGCGLILFNISKRDVLVSLIVIILSRPHLLAYCSPLERNNRHLMESNAIFQSYVKESIDGIETIKALNIAEHSKETASEKFLCNLLIQQCVIMFSHFL